MRHLSSGRRSWLSWNVVAADHAMRRRAGFPTRTQEDGPCPRCITSVGVRKSASLLLIAREPATGTRRTSGRLMSGTRPCPSSLGTVRACFWPGPVTSPTDCARWCAIVQGRVVIASDVEIRITPSLIPLWHGSSARRSRSRTRGCAMRNATIPSTFHPDHGSPRFLLVDPGQRLRRLFWTLRITP
jgi:hypothetical protein